MPTSPRKPLLVTKGTILSLRSGNVCAVRTDDGPDIEAVLPQRVVKSQGCLFGPLAGWLVRVEVFDGTRPNRICELKPAQ
jgi:hypothetical protein